MKQVWSYLFAEIQRKCKPTTYTNTNKQRLLYNYSTHFVAIYKNILLKLKKNSTMSFCFENAYKFPSVNSYITVKPPY